MYVDKKKLEGKKNASSDVITSSLCLSRDTDLVTWYAFNNGGIVFSTEVSEKTTICTPHPLLTGKKKSSKLFCWPEEFRWQVIIESASFYRCRSCDLTDLNTTTGKQIPKRDWFSWQEVISFTGTSLYRLPVGAVPVEKNLSVVTSDQPFWSWNLHQRPFHWCEGWGTGSSHVPVKPVKKPSSVVSSDEPFFDSGTSTRGLSTGVKVGVPVQSCSCEACQETPFSGFQWWALFWYWNLHQRPFHWCDCRGYRFQCWSDHRWGCSEGSPTKSCCDHWDPYLPCADFWTGTGPVQATGSVTSQPVMRDTGTSSAQTAGCGHRNPARGTG